jgi:hypothetical protein
MRFPIEPEGGYFPFFDSQLRGVHLTDAGVKRFVLGVPAAEWGDRRLSLMTWGQDELDGEVMLHPGGAAERALLDGLRAALTRGGPGTIRYAPEWHNGLGWDEREMFAHPLRYAELERRLANDEGRRQRRELLEARVGGAAARNRLTRAAGGAEASGEEADEWWKAMRALSEFYTETARAYGLLGPARPRRDERGRRGGGHTPGGGAE